MTNARRAGRIVGVLLLLLIASGAIGNFVLTDPVFAAPGFLVNAAAHPLNVSLSAVVGLVAGVIALGIAITAYATIRRQSEPMALWLFGIAVAGLALGAVEQIGLLSLLSLSKVYTSAVAPDEALYQALRGVVAAARNWAHFIRLLIGGSMLLVLFAALWRYAFIPRALAAVGVLAALLQMIVVVRPLFGREIVFPLLAPLGVVMVATAAWLLAKGFRDFKHAPAPESA